MAQELKHDVLKKMRLGGRPRVFRFDTPREFESARKNARYIQKNCPRPDGPNLICFWSECESALWLGSLYVVLRQYRLQLIFYYNFLTKPMTSAMPFMDVYSTG